VVQNLILVIPNGDKPFEFKTNAPAYAVGAALFQKDDKKKHYAIRYASKTLNRAEQNYNQ
jgi:hypothetical protein